MPLLQMETRECPDKTQDQAFINQEVLEAQETRTSLLVDNKQWWVTLSIIS
jgi:hypothetical protein